MASTVHHGVPRRFGWWYFQLKRMEFRSFGDEKRGAASRLGVYIVWSRMGSGGA